MRIADGPVFTQSGSQVHAGQLTLDVPCFRLICWFFMKEKKIRGRRIFIERKRDEANFFKENGKRRIQI